MFNIMKFRSIILKRVRFLFDGVKFARLSGVKVGSDCRIYTKEFGSEPFLIEIGNRVTISSNVTFINHDGAAWLIGDERGRRYLYDRIVVSDFAFIGANVTILPGVRIGRNVIVGAGSVVTRSIPDDCVVAGNPARYICSFEDYRSRALRWPAEEQIDRSGSYAKAVNSISFNLTKPELERTRFSR